MRNWLEINKTEAVLRACREMAKAAQDDELEDAEIVCERGECWLGYRRISKATVNRMLRLCLLRDGSDVKGCERYTLNSEGMALAADAGYVPLICKAPGFKNEHD